jgi:hypothetical protein
MHIYQHLCGRSPTLQVGSLTLVRLFATHTSPFVLPTSHLSSKRGNMTDAIPLIYLKKLQVLAVSSPSAKAPTLPSMANP